MCTTLGKLYDSIYKELVAESYCFFVILYFIHLGWMNRRRFCLQKGGCQEHISLITIRNYKETSNKPSGFAVALLISFSCVFAQFPAPCVWCIHQRVQKMDCETHHNLHLCCTTHGPVASALLPIPQLTPIHSLLHLNATYLHHYLLLQPTLKRINNLLCICKAATKTLKKGLYKTQSNKVSH